MPQDPYASIATAEPSTKNDPYASIATLPSASSPITPPAIAKPSVAMHESYLAGDPDADPDQSFLARTSKRVGDTGHSLNQTISGAIAMTERGTPEHADLVRRMSGPHPFAGPKETLARAWKYGPPGQIVAAAKDWAKDPANLAGDALTAGIMHEAGAEPSGSSEATTATPRGKTVPEPPASEVTPERVEAIEKANRGYRDATAQVQRKARLDAAAKGTVKELHQNLQETYTRARSSLDQRWGQFRQGMEGAQLDPAAAFNQIEDAKAKYLKGSPSSLKVFNDLAKEMGIQEFMEGAGGELKAIPGTGELPFDTARVHYSAIGDKLAQGNLPGNVYQALKSVQEGLDSQLTKAAESRKLGDQYTALKSSERQFRQDWVDPKSPLARAHKALDANFLEPQVMGRGNEYMSNQLRRYTEHGAKPHLPLAAKRIAGEAAEISKKVPEVKELPRPKPPKPPEKGTMARKAARLGGKVVGGSMGSAMGHPLLGYAVGGEAGAELYDRFKRPRTVPPPPVGDE
jgi:hypothetical protein